MKNHTLSDEEKEVLFITSQRIQIMNEKIKGALKTMAVPGGTESKREQIWQRIEADMKSVDAMLMTLGQSPVYSCITQDAKECFVRYLSDEFWTLERGE